MANKITVRVKDKQVAPFLLAASFSEMVKFEGKQLEGDVLYWLFSPQKEVDELVQKFYTKQEPRLPARDIFEAIETWLTDLKALKKIRQEQGL